MRWARIEDQNDAAGVEMPFTSLREMSGATDRDRERRQSAEHQAFRRVLHDVARDDFVQAPSAAQVYMRWARKADKRGGSAHMPSSMRQGGVEATKGADRPTAAAAPGGQRRCDAVPGPRRQPLVEGLEHHADRLGLGARSACAARPPQNRRLCRRWYRLCACALRNIPGLSEFRPFENFPGHAAVVRDRWHLPLPFLTIGSCSGEPCHIAPMVGAGT